MKYKALLLDIDNTLYDYNAVHIIAKKNVIDFCTKKFGIDESIITKAYEQARKKVHVELSETAASHNRLLYFQKMLEILNVNPLAHSFHIYNIYWDNFLEKMTPFEGIDKILERYKYRICLVTDLTAHIQYKKIKKLELDQYCNSIVTSEEAGKEKPHPYMFMSALNKLGVQSGEVCMIGDSFKKDVLGAASLGIKAIWLNLKNEEEEYDSSLVTEVNNVNEILELI
jgi:putative hydrolase of the HAD superfamily